MKNLSFLVVLACIGVASCFNTPDPAKLQCKTNAGCPTGYFCSSDHKCQKGSGSGSTNQDASIGPGGSGGRDGSVGDSSAGGSTNATNPDVPSGSPNGSTCQVNGECTQSHCVDGVCCESTCGGCKACSYALTGNDDGKCSPVASGVDPHDFCEDETASKPCGNDGTCDGNGACRKVGTNHVCANGSCSSDGTTFTPATTCDGKGECMPATSKSCGQYPCADTGCLVTCDPTTTPSPCDSGSYCNATTKVCTTQKSDGQPATQAIECTSGVVADGVCCHEACPGCKACTAALNGQDPSTTGQCLPVKAGGDDPHKTCTAVPPCGLDGKCDGAGACRNTAVNTACAADSCTGSTLTTSACDSAHHCTAATSGCPNSALCASTTACKTGCTSNSDCASGNYCASGTCKPKLVDGGSCAADSECQNGHCISGICCATTCGECNSCSTGTCKAADTGKACGSGSGQFCNNGQCGACPDGSTCNPNSNPCQTGKVSCSTGTAACLNPVNVADGTPNICGSGKVCKNGACALCNEGSSCTGDATDQCHTYGISCSTGDPVCKVSGNKANTTPCGPGQTCTSGTEYDQATCYNGACGTQPTKTCPSTGCNGTSCAAACTSSQTTCGTTCCDNSTSYCSGTSCAGKIPNGTSCPVNNNNSCSSNNCSGGLCCAGGTSNSNGVCCSPGQTGCSGSCVNTSTDSSNCGGCGSSGSSHICSGGYKCSGGTCQCPYTNAACGSSCTSCSNGATCSSSTHTCTCPQTNASCGANGNCTSCDTSNGQQCTNGSCQCALGMFAPGCRCLGWDFESGSASGWSADSGSVQTASGAGKGTYSLAVAGVNLGFSSSTSDVSVTVSFCPGGSAVTVPSNGFKLSVDIKFVSPDGLAFGDDGNGSGTPGILANGWVINGGAAPNTSGAWYHYDYTVPPYGGNPAATSFTLRFVPQNSWNGTIFLDNFALNQ